MPKSFTPDGSSPSRSEARTGRFISPSVRRFEGIWMQAKERMPDHVAQNSTNTGMRSKYALRLYVWAKKHVAAGTKRITLEDIRKLLGLESVKDANGKIREAPLAVWGNFRQRALDTAMAEINKKTDLHIEIESLEKVGPRVNALNFSIVAQKIPKTGRAKS
jgi:plasmid replication initiation protein